MNGKESLMLTDLISKRIRELRVKKDITQEKLAEKASVDFSYLGKIERGQKNNISIEMLDRIIHALEIDYDEFFSFADSQNDFKKLQYEISVSENKDEILKLINGIVNLDKKK